MCPSSQVIFAQSFGEYGGITSGLMEQLIHVAESSTQWVQLGLREDRPVWTTAGVRLAPGLWPFRRG